MISFEREEKTLLDEISNALENKVKELDRLEKTNTTLQEKLQNNQAKIIFIRKNSKNK